MQVLQCKFKPNKKTCDITLSDGEIINITSEAMLKYHIYSGVEIEQSQLDNAIEESDKSKALEKAINYLTKGYRSERQLKSYLKEKKYSSQIQDYVVDKLIEYNYINDENLANLFVQSNAKKMGVNKIKQKLYEKGISKKNIENSIGDIESQDDICFNICQKKWSSILKSKPSELEREEEYQFMQSAKGKLSRYLFSQGFDWEVIKSAINKVLQTSLDD